MKKMIYISLIFFYYLSSSIFPNSFSDMKNIPSGFFTMGDDSLQTEDVESSLIPVDSYHEHEVKLDSFFIDSHELTFHDFIQFIDDTNYITKAQSRSMFEDYWSLFSDYLEYPMVYVTFREALYYCDWLSQKTGDLYRLPTEAEWEYVATSGKFQKFPWGKDYKRIDLRNTEQDSTQINFRENVSSIYENNGDKTSWNIMGMYGNVREFTLDGWDPLYYNKSSSINPLNELSIVPMTQVSRGRAGYYLKNDIMGVKARDNILQTIPSDITGFRIIKEKQPTIFNEDSKYPFIYFQNFCIAKETLISYEKPSSSENIIEEINQSEKIWMLYRTNQKMELNGVSDYWYFVYTDTYNGGWVFGEDLEFITPFYISDKQ